MGVEGGWESSVFSPWIQILISAGGSLDSTPRNHATSCLWAYLNLLELALKSSILPSLSYLLILLSITELFICFRTTLYPFSFDGFLSCPHFPQCAYMQGFKKSMENLPSVLFLFVCFHFILETDKDLLICWFTPQMSEIAITDQAKVRGQKPAVSQGAR